MQKILALDLGTNAGWCYTDSVGTESGFFTAKTYVPWAKNFLDLVDLYKPEIIVCSQTNSFGHFNATRKMYCYFGIICYLSEKLELPVIEFNDSQARKAVFGIGRGKKEFFHNKFNEMFPDNKHFTGDQKDAICLALGWQLLQKES